jgi:hypothetical protein
MFDQTQVTDDMLAKAVKFIPANQFEEDFSSSSCLSSDSVEESNRSSLHASTPALHLKTDENLQATMQARTEPILELEVQEQLLRKSTVPAILERQISREKPDCTNSQTQAQFQPSLI